MIRLLLLAALGVGLTLTASAQDLPGFEREIAPFSVLDADGQPYEHPFFGGLNHPRPQLVDLTGNGRLDLAVQEVLGRLIVFEATGETGPNGPRYAWRSDRWQELDIGTWYRFADLTGNGLPDLITQHPIGQVRFFRNEGTAEQPRFTLAAEPLLDTRGEPVWAEDTNVPAVADIDGDGRLDLFMGQADRGHIRYYRHEGVVDGVPQFAFMTNTFQNIEIYEPSPSCDPFREPPRPPIPDEPVQETATPPSLQGGRPPAPERPTRLHGENALAFADLDGSGTLDLFWGDFFTPSLYYFANEGTPQEAQFRFVAPRFPLDDPLTSAGYNVPAFGDATGDGLTDLAIGIIGGFCSSTANLTDNLYLLTNTGSADAPVFTETTARLIHGVDVGRVAFPAFLDLTGDGRKDLLLGSAFQPDGPARAAIVRYDQVGEPGETAFQQVDGDFLALDLDFANHYALAVSDLYGTDDLVIGTFGGRIYGLANQSFAGQTTFAEPEELVDETGRRLDVGQTAAPTLADLTGNGLPDLLVGTFRGPMRLFHNVGSPGNPVFRLMDEDFLEADLGRSTAPHFADLTGNGLPDLLVGSERSGIAIYHNLGEAGAPRFERVGVLDPGRAQLAPSVVELDGQRALVVGTRGGGMLFYRITE